MFRWIHENKWLPTINLSVALFLMLGGTDLILLGEKSLIIGGIFAAAVLFARSMPWLSIALVLVGEATEIVIGLTPAFSSISIAIVVLLIATFGNRPQRITSLFTSIASAVVVAWFFVFGDFATFSDIGIQISDSQQLIAFVAAALLTVGWITLSWLVGRLAFVQMEHVGSPLDRALTLLTQARLNFELARQNERLEIARDLSELLIQRVGAVLSLTEGGLYAVKQNPEVATRVLERSTEAAKSAQVELRRLFDLLHSAGVGGGVTPRLADLEALVIAYRELGYNAELSMEGEPFLLDQGSELALYKIVFEALDNVRKHTPIGTNVTIDFTWVNPGLQLMIKDNGVEHENRSKAQLGEIIEGYGVEEDVAALVQEIDGSTLSVLRERAALYEGTVEAFAEPGVGFTVAAIFPNLKIVVEGK